MTKELVKLTAGVAVMAGALAAQGVPVPVEGSGFQQATVMGRSGGVIMPAQAGGRSAAQLVNGKPISATEERKTVQTLADGTQLENSDTNLFYRDSQGRTRVETTLQGKTTIRINDPVAHTSIFLDPSTRTARKNNVVAMAARSGAPGLLAGVQPIIAGGGGGRGGRAAVTFDNGNAAGAQKREYLPAPTSEELGVQTINGVAAQGTRTKIVIPTGQIGNNRDLNVVNERWFSSEIQMLVKSVNTDPRFGTTTYQLTNIVQGEPASALFQIPGDYTVIEPGK